MKKLAILGITVLFVLGMVMSVVPTGSVMAGGGGGGIDNPPGIPLYVIIEVTWDGNPAHAGSWTVWGPIWDPVMGTGPILASCPGGGAPSTCLDMSNYQFTLRGKTLQFDEVMVPGVRATPQTSHVVLKDLDGDMTYTGSLAAGHYFPWAPEPDGSWAILYFDRIDYDVTGNSAGQVVQFHYLQYEHKKLK